MGTGMGRASSHARKALLASVAVLACAAAMDAVHAPVYAQQLDTTIRATPGAQMLLEADNLVYDNDRNTVSAVGGVQIDYDGYRLVANRVTYDRNSGRLIASEGVEIVDRDGNRIQSQQIDITEDFRDGFVQALRVESADRTYFAAESAERRDGEVTTFQRGIYTACEPCVEQPDKPPTWRIGARQIIWNGRTRTIRFEGARFEFFGYPIAFLPFFEIPDPTVKQKSGFLSGSIGYSSNLGFSTTVPYYFALSPTYDLTVRGTYYTRQGFLGEAEWRQQFETGGYNLRVAGIWQQQPGAFGNPGVNIDSSVRGRGMISSTGHFNINPRWSFGWDVMAQSDKNFARTYGLEGNNALVRTSQIYLTGLNDRNWFDLRAQHFQVQENLLDSNAASRNTRQPWVLPSFDYRVIADRPVGGGELSFTVNAQNLSRNTLDSSNLDQTNPTTNLRGLDGQSGRFTAEAEWKRNIITPGGVVITPLLHARGDTVYTNYGQASLTAIAGLPGSPATDIRSNYFRYMATAGLEARWPLLFATAGTSHVFEPIGQLFIRPDAPFGSTLGIPNEDAQSLVFDATSLFERDKFSGYDRIEGGTRANLGFRYSGDLGGGWTTNAIFGQSFHLAGRNPYTDPDFVNVGAASGLQTARSDYVGQIGLRTPVGLYLSAGARFDQANFQPRRADVSASYATPLLSLSTRYSYIAAQPAYGFTSDRQEVRVAGSLQFAEHWRALASATYDFESRTVVNRSIGLVYDDQECFLVSFSYTERQPTAASSVSRNFGFRVTLRTLGDFGTDSTTLGAL